MLVRHYTMPRFTHMVVQQNQWNILHTYNWYTNYQWISLQIYCRFTYIKVKSLHAIWYMDNQRTIKIDNKEGYFLQKKFNKNCHRNLYIRQTYTY